MVANWLKILLFVAGGTSAAVGTAYYTGLYDPWRVEERPAPIAAAEPEPVAEPDADRSPEREIPAVTANLEDGTDAEPQPAANNVPREPDAEIEARPEPEEQIEDELTVPSFDLVRVEPNGAMVIAGTAEPDSDLEVVAGAEVIARVDVGPSGDFAAVLDDALKPGDYQIVLRSTGPAEGLVVTSVETAIVSVPEDDKGEVLALVEEPGMPAKLITIPQGDREQQEGTTDTAQVDPQAEAVASEGAEPQDMEQDVALANPQDEPASLESASASNDELAISASTDGPTAASTPGQGGPETDEHMGEPTAPHDTEQDVAVALPQGEPADRENTSAGGEEVATDPAINERSGGEGTTEQGSFENAPAAVQKTEAPAAEESRPISDETQVAARSEPEAEAPTRPMSPRNALAVEAVEIEGRAVFVAGRGTPGSTVRVYANEILLGETEVSDGGRFLIETQMELPVGDYIVRADVVGPRGEVTARAAVPFKREPGEAIAAVAPVEPRVADISPADEQQTEDAAEPAATSDDPVTAQSQSTVTPGEPEAPDAASPPETPATTIATHEEPGAEIPDQAAIEPVPPARASELPEMPQSAAIEETLEAPLEAVDGSVIIRRGDSLWRISRRVYGRGVRYSTIYLANQDQIRDPDMIWPGQVFTVPDETEEGEKADLSTVSDQLAPPTATQ